MVLLWDSAKHDVLPRRVWSPHMLNQFKRLVASQFEAGLCMFHDCVSLCPDSNWGQPIAKYPFWQAAHHTLCYVDLYLSKNEATFEQEDMRTGPSGLHPNGWSEFRDEYPSRRFERGELLEYTDHCRQKARRVVAAETVESLDEPSGFHWLKFNRAELHVYNIRHLQHHTGQLGAFLRRVDADHALNPKWVGTGWK